LTEKAQTAHRVKVSAGTTINTGNYENLRVDIGLELDGVGDPNPTFDKAWGFVETKLVEKTREIKDELDK
jgi:hypothetical protein